MRSFIPSFSAIVNRTKTSIIRELLALTNDPKIISFAGGLPDPALFPYEQLKEISEYVIQEYGKSALQYGPTGGIERLKEEIVKLSARMGEKIDSENVLITTASQQGLNLVGKTFLDAGDVIFVGLPTYLGGLQAFEAYGANIKGVDLDLDGIKMDQLEEKLIEGKKVGEKPKFVYAVPDFQNPSGVTMSEERRKKLVALSHQYDFLIVEDSPYRALRYESAEVPSIFSLDQDSVLSLRTFSKTLIPGFRVGYTIGPKEIIRKLSIMKQSMDLCTSPFNQYLVAEFCSRGYLDAHIETLRKVYKVKRDTMLNALKTYMPDNVSWSQPMGGLFLWLMLPKHFDSEILFRACIEKQNVAFIMGSAFCCDGSGKNRARLNFSYPSNEQIDEGIKRLACFVKEN